MNLPLPVPSEEPMLYFLSNSLAVVGAAGVLFFILGLWFGFLTWGRFKRRSRAFQEETSLLLHEIATLKRRIAEEAVEPSLPVSFNDESPSVELQPLLFPMGPPVVAPAAVVESEPAPARVVIEPAVAALTSVTAAAIIAKAKPAVVEPTSLPDSVGAEPEKAAPAPTVVPTVAEPETDAVEPLAVEIPPEPPVVTSVAVPLPAMEADAVGPVVSLAAPGGAFPPQMLPDLLAVKGAEAPATSQMSATVQVSHDAGPLGLPMLPSFESLATTLSSADLGAMPELPPMAPAPLAVAGLPAMEVATPPVQAAPPPEDVPTAHDAVPQVVVPKPGHWFAAELDQALGCWDPQIGFCYTQSPERWDDLTLLRGLAESLQDRLNDTGIFTFKQIAVWTDAQSAEVGLRLHSAERIQRDRWVQQARDLHYLKYGERLG